MLRTVPFPLPCCDYCALPAPSCDEAVHVRTSERHMHFADRCTAWKVVSLSEKVVLRSPLFQKTHCLVNRFPCAGGTSYGRLNDCLMEAWFIPLTQELNPSAQRCMTRFFIGNLVSWTVRFVNICVKNQQIHQLIIQFINYVWYLLHVSALHCHLQGAFLVPSEWCSVEEQSTEYCGWTCWV
jgi:hypothetical protein